MLKECFKEHRKEILAQMEDDSILLVFSRRKEESFTNERYNVNRNYFYLSGVLEFDNVVLLSKLKGKENAIIYINPYDEFKAKWVGAPFSKEKVTELSGIKDVRYLHELKYHLESYYNMCNTVYLDFEESDFDGILTETENLAKKIKLKKPWVNVKNARPFFQNARMVKHEEELEEMKKAIHITRLGIENILMNMKEAYEYQLESYFDQAVKYNGGTGYAFATIAASGKNATCLHYSDNDSIAHNGDLILFDLGASLNMYCSDISRTFPVNGKFTERQKEVYNIVLEAQRKVFEAAKPGVTIRDLQQVVIKHYEAELTRIGLITDPKDVSKYYYHGISHHIGLDCHDLSDHFAPLKAGEVISNEPGLYIEEWGIGIRIEDDMMITEDGSINLSEEILKTVDEIEAFMAKNNKR